MWEDSLLMQDRSRSKAQAGRLVTVLVLRTWKEVGRSKASALGSRLPLGGSEEKKVA